MKPLRKFLAWVLRAFRRTAGKPGNVGRVRLQLRTYFAFDEHGELMVGLGGRVTEALGGALVEAGIERNHVTERDYDGVLVVEVEIQDVEAEGGET